MRFVIGCALTVFCMFTTGYASADLVTTHISSDAELVEFLSDTMFVCEGRIGDLGGAQTFELDLGHETGNPAQTADYAWQSGVVEPFSLTYDGGTGLVTFSLGGVTLYYTTPYFDFEVVFVRTRAVDDGTSMVVTDLVLDGESVNDSSIAVGPNGLDILLIVGGELNDGFTVTGSATLSWTGSPPTHSRLAFQVKVAKLAQIGIEAGSWSAVKKAFH
ncbi:MAG: hypothetical protein JSV33_00400 [bacterium]|nr:MAG: hypothetical protein JSV33_00400 [bacterium]